MTQRELGTEAEMKQARISSLERVGDASFSIETLLRLASALRVGLSVKFIPISEMLEWENNFTPDSFDVTCIEKDEAFLNPEENRPQRKTSTGLSAAWLGQQAEEGNGTTRFAAHGDSVPSWKRASIADSNSLSFESSRIGAALSQDTHEQGSAA
jgi:transcriptional regulator with XRE-family HTH domain